MCPQQFQTVIPVSIMGCSNKCECAKQRLPMMDTAQSTHKHCLLNSGAIIRPELSAASSQCEQLGNCSHQPSTHLALYKPRPPDKHKTNPYRPSREHETNQHKAAQGHGSNATQSHWMTSTILSGGNQTQAMSFWRQHMHPAGPRTYQSGNMCPQQFQTVIPVSIMGCSKQM